MWPSNNRSIRRLARLGLPYQPPLLHWTLAFFAGAALSLTAADVWIVASTVGAIALLAASSAAGMNPAARLYRVNLALLLCSPLLIGCGFWRAETTALRADGLAAAELGDQAVRLEGTVADDPVLRGAGVRFLLDAERIELGAERRSIRARIQMHSADPLELEPGDRIAVEATLDPTALATADYPEYLGWLAERGIAASGFTEPGGVELLATDRLSWWRSAAADARNALNRSLRDALPPPLSGIARGMITGRVDAIDPELRGVLNDTSLSHLIVISGGNLTLLTAIVMAAAGWLLGRRPAALLAMLAALAYGALVGPDPPVQRAIWMAVVFAAAHLTGRGSSALYAVGAAAGLMVALDPHILLDLSFQLTLAGTLGIVVLMPAFAQDFLSGERGLGGAIRDAALMTFVASLTTMPLIVLHFERAALTGIPANLLVAPFFAWMLLGSAATAVLGLISDALAAALAWPLAWLPLRWLVLVAEECSRLPGAGEAIRGFGLPHLLLIYAAIAVAALRPHRDRVRRWNRAPRPAAPNLAARALRRIGIELIPNLRAQIKPMTAAGLATALGAALWLSALGAPDEALRIHFIDVGQGDAALIVTPERQTILIDTGERSQDILAALRQRLPAETERIGLVVITHPQSDHGEALWAILDHYDVGQVLLSAYAGSTRFGQRLLSLLREREIETLVAAPGRQIRVPGRTDLLLDLLWPPTGGLREADLADPNATSIVIRARYGEAAFLFTGDINVEQELRLVREPCASAVQPCELRADVLKVAHQGSRFSSSMLFLEAVRPTLAILSAGVDNRHGHPHPDVIAALQRVGAAPLLTAERGDISLTTDGQSISLTTER